MPVFGLMVPLVRRQAFDNGEAVSVAVQGSFVSIKIDACPMQVRPQKS